MSELKSYGTFLPIFPGLYNTGFGVGEQYGEWLAERIGFDMLRGFELYEGKLAELISMVEDAEDWRDYEAEYARGIVDAVAGLTRGVKGLRGFDGFEFQCVVSPREYNFANDAIDVEARVNPSEFFPSILSLIASEEFDKHIRVKYTSGPGFISHYPSDANEWRSEIESGQPCAHMLGAVLEYILKSSGIDEWFLMDMVDVPTPALLDEVAEVVEPVMRAAKEESGKYREILGRVENDQIAKDWVQRTAGKMIPGVAKWLEERAEGVHI